MVNDKTGACEDLRDESRPSGSQPPPPGARQRVRLIGHMLEHFHRTMRLKRGPILIIHVGGSGDIYDPRLTASASIWARWQRQVDCNGDLRRGSAP
jgi:hypothetical protein